MYNLQIEKTADGSHTFFVSELDEHYHSINGALTESLHVFIEAGFRQVAKTNISILEIGLGTGLNAILTFSEAEKTKQNIRYTAIELHPISDTKIEESGIFRNLNFDRFLIDAVHKSEWNKTVEITPFLNLCKINGDLTQTVFRQTFDLIYFDAFAPDKQPEMWSLQIFSHLFEQTNENGILTTYCAKGSVRRMLQQAGYHTERLPGPPGKREMLRARKYSIPVDL